MKSLLEKASDAAPLSSDYSNRSDSGAMAVPSFGRQGQSCDQTVRCLSAAFLSASRNRCNPMILLNVRWSFRPGRSARRLQHLYGQFARWPYQRSVVSWHRL